MPLRRLLLRASRRPCRGRSRFTDPFAAANVGTPLGVPLHPTQLYEAGAELLILGAAARDRTTRPAVRRADVLAYMLLYAVSRFIIEFYRGDQRGIVSASSRRRSSSRSSSCRSRS